jgi:hypothetical protein
MYPSTSYEKHVMHDLDHELAEYALRSFLIDSNLVQLCIILNSSQLKKTGGSICYLRVKVGR